MGPAAHRRSRRSVDKPDHRDTALRGQARSDLGVELACQPRVRGQVLDLDEADPRIKGGIPRDIAESGQRGCPKSAIARIDQAGAQQYRAETPWPHYVDARKGYLQDQYAKILAQDADGDGDADGSEGDEGGGAGGGGGGSGSGGL